MTVTLRPYQTECLGNIWQKYEHGVKRQLIVLCTGAGKTTIFSHLPDHFHGKKKKTLIIAHREELLDQAMARIQSIAPHLNVSIEQGARVADVDADVIIASVATLGRAGSERIKKFNVDEFGLIVIDESHHATASTYSNILDYFCSSSSTEKPTSPLLLGVTATPNRADNRGLDGVFQEIVFKYDILDGIKDGYLAPIKAFTVRTHESLDNVSRRAGDFALNELSDAVNTPERNKLIVDSYQSISPGEIALVFAVDVQHTMDLTEEFRRAGISAACVLGETPKDERKDILEKFGAGEIKVVVNCATLTEGYDNPNITTVMFARPTSSSGLFIQMAGRGLRLAEGKEFAKLIDFVDNMAKNKIVTASTLIGLDKPLKVYGEDLMGLKEKLDELLEKRPGYDVSEADLDKLDSIIKEVDIFALARIDDEVKSMSSLAWARIIGNHFRISLGTNDAGCATLADIEENAIGKFEMTFYDRLAFNEKNPTAKRIKEIIHATADTLEEAFQRADSCINRHFSDRMNLVDQSAKWRRESPSEKQIAILQKNGIFNAEKLSKGEASNLISKIFAQKAR